MVVLSGGQRIAGGGLSWSLGVNSLLEDNEAATRSLVDPDSFAAEVERPDEDEASSAVTVAGATGGFPIDPTASVDLVRSVELSEGRTEAVAASVSDATGTTVPSLRTYLSATSFGFVGSDEAAGLFPSGSRAAASRI